MEEHVCLCMYRLFSLQLINVYHEPFFEGLSVPLTMTFWLSVSLNTGLVVLLYGKYKTGNSKWLTYHFCTIIIVLRML